MDLASLFIMISAGAVGTVVGSFLNVVILRGARGEPLTGRSYCESCKKTLSAGELIPIFSFLIQKGHCRSCGVPLLWQYPLVEFATGLSYATAAWLLWQKFTLSSELFLFLPIFFLSIGAFIVILVSDLKYYLIPNGALAILLALGILAIFYRQQNGTFFSLALDLGTTFLLSFLLFSLWLFSQGRWMGLGDSKLFFVISLLLGFPLNIVAFLFSFWSGALVGGGLLLTGQKKLGGLIPFGPFIILGGGIAFLGGEFFLQSAGFNFIVELLLS